MSNKREDWINLLQETLEVLEGNGKTKEDVLFVCTSEESISWETFAKEADNTYDNSYGTAYVKEELCVVGKDWWLERREYDGSEWWEFKQRPDKRKLKEVESLNNIFYLRSG
jgi:hypothetical protein